MIIFLIGLFIFFLFILLISSLLSDGGGGGSGINSMFFLFFLLLVFIYLFIKSKNPNIQLPNIFSSITSNKPEIDIQIKNPLPIKPRIKQVFNIPEQQFNYQDAKSVCKAFDAELATVDQMDEAYKQGADWCNMGWADNQLGLYPTQQSTYDKLQTIPGHEHDCGIPGVNGGYISSSQTKLGVNCYGVKPDMDAVEQDIMNNVPFYPMTKEEKEMEDKIDYWKQWLNQIILSPFNHDSWSKL
jgi:hypothetical protein